MKYFFTLLAAVLLTATTYGQVGIGSATPDVSAVLDVQSTTKGFLLPRMTETERDNIASPATGLVVWCTNCSLEGELQFFNGPAWTKSGVLPGTVQGQMRYWNGTDWVVIPSGIEGQVLTYANGFPAWIKFGNSLPDAPTIGTVVAGNQQATVPFTAPSSNGGSAITIYTATSSPEGITGTLSQSGSGSITVTGLTNGTAYTFTVTATNGIGTSAASDASNSVLPGPQQVGDFYGGGVIFYRFVAGDAGYVAGQSHDLIAAIVDQSSGIRWYNGSYTVTGATRTAIGTGSENTDDIIAVQGATETSYAAGLARAYTGGGYTDWFLPSKDELNKMYLEKSTINTTASVNSGSDFSESNFYWSSTMNNYNSAWSQVFNTGGQTGNLKTYLTHYVRAVRAF
jgi:hypothetical protein